MCSDEAFLRSKLFSFGGLVEFLIVALMNGFETLLKPCSSRFFFTSSHNFLYRHVVDITDYRTVYF